MRAIKHSFFAVVFALSLLAAASCDKLPDGVRISDIPEYYFENNYLDGCLPNDIRTTGITVSGNARNWE